MNTDKDKNDKLSGKEITDKVDDKNDSNDGINEPINDPIKMSNVEH